MRKDSLARILSISPKPKDQDLYRPVKSSVLEIKGFLRHIKIWFRERTNIFDLSVLDHEADNEHTRAIGPSWHEYWGDVCILELDSIARDSPLDCFAFFITIHQSKDTESGRIIACLLLQRRGKKGSKFTRIGTLVLNDLYGLKMLYKVHQTLDEDVWEGMQNRIKAAQEPITEAEKKRKQEKESDEREAAEEDATTDTTTATHREVLEGVDALYQFDNEIESIGNLRTLAPQVIHIV